MAGSGMVKHHLRLKEPGWKHKAVINGSAAVVSFAVVVIFAVTKFFEGAWIVLVLFPVLVFVLIRLNQRYREEAAVLGEAAAEAAAEARPLPTPGGAGDDRPARPGHGPRHPVRQDP